MPEIIKRLPSIVFKWIEPNVRMYLTSRQPVIWLMALLIGLGVSLAAIIFRELISYIQLLWLFDRSENIATAARKLPWFVILLAPAVGGGIVGWILVKMLPHRQTRGGKVPCPQPMR